MGYVVKPSIRSRKRFAESVWVIMWKNLEFSCRSFARIDCVPCTLQWLVLPCLLRSSSGKGWGLASGFTEVSAHTPLFAVPCESYLLSRECPYTFLLINYFKYL